ncbi:MAG: high-potential iron-sulfur protein [Caldimonas sp.]
MKLTERRIFLLQAAACATTLATTATGASAQGLPKLAETDPQAIALGYKHDTTKVDAKKYPKHAVTQKCSNCQLFQGKAADAWGPCPLFAGKQVAATGWCSAWAAKAA